MVKTPYIRPDILVIQRDRDIGIDAINIHVDMNLASDRLACIIWGSMGQLKGRNRTPNKAFGTWLLQERPENHGGRWRPRGTRPRLPLRWGAWSGPRAPLEGLL